eukprot:jgi/Mesvir1/16340/Mv18089-RA.1
MTRQKECEWGFHPGNNTLMYLTRNTRDGIAFAERARREGVLAGKLPSAEPPRLICGFCDELREEIDFAVCPAEGTRSNMCRRCLWHEASGGSFPPAGVRTCEGCGSSLLSIYFPVDRDWRRSQCAYCVDARFDRPSAVGPSRCADPALSARLAWEGGRGRTRRF